MRREEEEEREKKAWAPFVGKGPGAVEVVVGRGAGFERGRAALFIACTKVTSG